MINGRSALALLAASLLTLGASQPAVAQQPGIFREPVDTVVTETSCGFPIEIRTTGTAVIHIFPTDLFSPRVIITAPRMTVTFTNLLTGESISTPSPNIITETPQEDGTRIDSLTGLFWRLVVRGEGLITADVGKIDLVVTFKENGEVESVEQTFSSGQQNGDFLTQVCTVLD